MAHSFVAPLQDCLPQGDKPLWAFKAIAGVRSAGESSYCSACEDVIGRCVLPVRVQGEPLVLVARSACEGVIGRCVRPLRVQGGIFNAK